MTQFTQEQIAALGAPLSREHVKQREQAGRKFSYIEGWHVIDEANRIFGFDAWDRMTVECRCINERERKIGQTQRDGWQVGYISRVRVIVHLEPSREIVREGTGFGSGIDVDLGAAHESAIKEAETDAMKRALMTFGNQFGLALYDKDQANVEAPERPVPGPPSARASLPREEEQITLGQIRDRIISAIEKADTAERITDILRVNAADIQAIQRASVKTYDRIMGIAGKAQAALSMKKQEQTDMGLVA